MRGEAQNVTISKEIIDSIFENIKTVSQLVVLTGGEPLLELDMIDYFCKKYMLSNWTAEIQIVTNGNVSKSVRERIIDLLSLVSKTKNVYCSLYLSKDPFHGRIEKNFKSLLESFQKEINKRECIKIICGYKKETEKQYTVNVLGKAIDNMDMIKEYDNKSFSIYYKHVMDMKYPHYIRIAGDRINCSMNILANGNVSLLQEYDYDYADNTSLGNLLYTSFKSIIDDYNNNIAFCDCWECSGYNTLFNYYHYIKNVSGFTRKYLLLNLMRYEIPLTQRSNTIRMYPSIERAIIKDQFPILKEKKWFEMLINLYNNKYPNDLICDLNESVFDKLILMIKEKESDNY